MAKNEIKGLKRDKEDCTVLVDGKPVKIEKNTIKI